MGESERERRARVERERQQRNRIDKQNLERRMKEAAAAEEAAIDRMNDAEDAELDAFFKEHFQDDIDKIQADVKKYLTDDKMDEILANIKKAARKNPRKAIRIGKRHRAKIKAAAKEARKKKGGCGVIALIMLAVAAFATWQGGSAIVEALTR